MSTLPTRKKIARRPKVMAVAATTLRYSTTPTPTTLESRVW
jgi:hypothetical protein